MPPLDIPIDLGGENINVLTLKNDYSSINNDCSRI